MLIFYFISPVLPIFVVLLVEGYWMTDRELVERIKKNEELAYKELVDNYQKMVINTCYGILQDYAEAEDIAQEVFVEVYNSIHKFRGDSKLSSWLYSIAINKSINANKKNRFKRFFTKIEEAFDGSGEGKQTKSEDLNSLPEKKLESKENTAIINKAIASLPKNQKIALTLHKYEELPYKQIAEIMNISLMSVESLIYRAKKNLKKDLLKHYYDK